MRPCKIQADDRRLRRLKRRWCKPLQLFVPTLNPDEVSDRLKRPKFVLAFSTRDSFTGAGYSIELCIWRWTFRDEVVM